MQFFLPSSHYIYILHLKQNFFFWVPIVEMKSKYFILCETKEKKKKERDFNSCYQLLLDTRTIWSQIFGFCNWSKNMIICVKVNIDFTNNVKLCKSLLF